MNAIEIKNLTVAYGENIALEDLNLNIEVGSLMALVGPNGAGKSTLIKTILKFLKQITGEIKINAKTLAYVPQRNSVDWDFPTTLFDVVEMGCYGRVGLFKRVSKEEKQKVLKAIEQVGMLEFKDRQISELSGGQQQRAFIARALVQETKILLLDEPTSALDLNNAVEFMKILKCISTKKNISVIIIIHDLNLASLFCDNLIVLKDGKFIKKGSPYEVINEQNIKDVYNLDCKVLYNEDNKPYIIPKT